MPRKKKKLLRNRRPMRKKQVNVDTLSIGCRKYMREHPLYGPSFRREENIAKLFKRGPRRFRKEGSYISR